MISQFLPCIEPRSTGRTRCVPILLFLCMLLPAASVVHAATYYVAGNGSDSAGGTSMETAFKTIQRAVNAAGAGDTVLIRGGTYREEVVLQSGGGQPGNYVTIRNYRDEIAVIKGSDLVTGWVQHDGAIWKKTGWQVNSQQVFADFDERKPVRPLQQIGMPSRFYKAFEYPKPVGKGVADMTPGSFYYDPAAATLYVWLADGSDPNRHVMEASTRKRLFHVGRPYVRLQGLAFRHSNVSAFAQQGAAVELGAYSVFEGCDVQWTDFAGVSLGYLQTGAQVLNSNISNNGNSGVNGPGSYAFKVSNTTMNGNNYRNFNPLWHAGGFKATTKAYGAVTDNEVAGNNGSGIWFDYANGDQPIVVRNNYVHDNGPVDSAIFIEVSRNAEVSNNLLVNNSRRGIYLSGSDNARVFNNTIYGTGGYAGIELGGMPRPGATLTNNRIYNNIISHGSSRYDLIIMPSDGAGINANTSDYNNIYRPGEAIRMSSARQHGDLRGWQSATGMDQRSLSVDPRFVAPTGSAAAGFELQAGSPMVGAGSVTDALPQADGRDDRRGALPSRSIGAYGVARQHTAPAPAPERPSRNGG